LDFLLSKQRTH